MASFLQCTYSRECLLEIKKWGYGENWPSVYVIYNDSKAYVGETLDAFQRTQKHLTESQFNEMTHICFISHKTFNKSVILDLESFLIKHMGADLGGKSLINGNSGIVNHNYFYKEAYSDEFRDIWSTLQSDDFKIVSNSIEQIENSNLFKYSPYKTLNDEQKTATYKILKYLSQINNKSHTNATKSLIWVNGCAGTGKTIVAVYLMKLLADILNNRVIWDSIIDSDTILDILELKDKIKKNGVIKTIGFVVPMDELNKAMKDIFRSIDGLDESMVLKPVEVATSENNYDLLIVDEAHRLYKNLNLPQGSSAAFKRVNEVLYHSKYKMNDKNFPSQMDWILEKSKTQVVFYDEYQAIRSCDIGADLFKKICGPRIYEKIELESQMRCKGGSIYYNYIKKILFSSHLGPKDYRPINNYELRIFDNIDDFLVAMSRKEQENSLCSIVAGPSWTLREGTEKDIIIEDKSFRWYTGQKEAKNGQRFLRSIHKIQGFDLNYAGVIFGEDLFYDSANGCISVNKKANKDSRTKSSGDDAMRQYLLNIYLTLMTRGIDGTYVYASDKNLREYLKQFF